MAEHWQKQLAETANLDLEASDHLIVFDPSQLEGQKFVISQEEGLMQPYIEEVACTVPESDVGGRGHDEYTVPGEVDNEDDTAVVPNDDVGMDFYTLETDLYSSMIGEEKLKNPNCDENCNKGSYFRKLSEESGYGSEVDFVF